MFLYTFHTDDINFVYDYYLDRSSILYICKHFGIDQNNLPIRTHLHIISKEDFILDYNSIFTYKEYIDVLDAKKFVSYCENGHCDYEIIFKNIFFNTFISSIISKTHTIDDLINEIVYNSENKIIKSHSYYLKKYGKVYLFNFKKIREMFDYSSAFYDWTDTSSVPP